MLDRAGAKFMGGREHWFHPTMLKTLYGPLRIRAIVSALVMAPFLFAQGGENLPAIRAEAREVEVPTSVCSPLNGWRSIRLGATDFRLFEDGREQKIKMVALESAYGVLLDDNMGVQTESYTTPNGKWMRLSDSHLGGVTFGVYYIISYVPPASPEGSCHRVKVKVVPKDAKGSRLTTAEIHVGSGALFNRTEEVDRQDLLVFARTQYCNTAHSASDPLNGTKMSKQMESVAAADKAREKGLSLRVTDFYDEAGASRVHVTLDFSMGGLFGTSFFEIGFLGMVYRKDGALAARFSDVTNTGCDPEQQFGDPRICAQHPNHYETQVGLAPGDYDLRVVLDYGGDLRSVRVPISVAGFDGKHLALSGVALCKRFHPHAEHRQPEGWPAMHAMPIELVPLVSKGIEFTPTGESQFKKKDPMSAYFEVYEPRLRESGSSSVYFQMRVSDAKTGEVKIDSGLRPADSYIQAGSAVIPISQQIALDKLAQGTYRLEVQASDAAGDHTDWRATDFTVE
jgi:hypothetical protein